MLSNAKIFAKAGLVYDGVSFGLSEEESKKICPDEYRKGKIAKLEAEIQELINAIIEKELGE
jgi:hypothetical protein